MSVSPSPVFRKEQKKFAINLITFRRLEDRRIEGLEDWKIGRLKKRKIF